ncbi:MAG TPA: hypothetical protein VGE22_06695 [Solimonas sp.]
MALLKQRGAFSGASRSTILLISLEMTNVLVSKPLKWGRRNVLKYKEIAPAWHLRHRTDVEHHRGQATTLLMQFGIDPGMTDLPAMPDDA